MHLTIDFETRSRCDIKRGSWRYAEDESTDALCLAVKIDATMPYVWHPEKITQEHDAQWIDAEEIHRLIAEADVIEAHNSEFEQAIWHCVMHLKYGWPDLDPRKLRCSAAAAAQCGLPRALGEAAAVLGLAQRKDYDGRAVMMKMCKPVKTRRRVNGVWQVTESWHEDTADFQKLLNYCAQDVNTEYALSQALAQLPPSEVEVWRLDQTMNRRGILIDVAACEAMIGEIAKAEVRLLAEWVQLTRGRVSSPTQIDKTLEFFQTEFGAKMDGLTKQDVVDELDDLSDPDIETPDSWLEIGRHDPRFKRLLELRQLLSKASAKKYRAILNRVGRDHRARSLLMYHGAGTGRWTAKGPQFQNLPSRNLAVEAEDVPAHLDMAKAGVMDACVDDTLAAASACIRGCLIAAPGHRFIAADYSAIEGRVLAWLAGEKHVIDAYVKGLRLYCVAASGIYKLPYEEIEQGRKHAPYKMMDAVGKVIELACGYQGAIGAFRSMAKNYGMSVPDAEAKEAIAAWRESRPMTVALWKGLEKAAFEAVSAPGSITTFRAIKFRKVGSFLVMRLPSGRYLYYFDAHLEPTKMPWTDDDGNPVWKDTVTFYGVDSKTKKWSMQHAYGGLWTENAVQAIARDLMAGAMVRLEKAGYRPVLSVHDEVLAETPIGHGSLEEFEQIMCQLPVWAEGLPVTAEGWEGPRYKK